MSTWNDVKTGMRTVTNRVICKTDALAEEAALALKKKTVEAHLAAAYEKLGRVTYSFSKKGEGALSEHEPYLQAIAKVEELRKELRTVQAAIRTAKEKNASESSEKATEQDE